MSDTVYILYTKYFIEDYYPVKSTIGVFSSREEAEKGIELLAVRHKVDALNRYIVYTNRPESTRDFWESKKRLTEESLRRKQEGSNSWKQEKREHDKICKILETQEFEKTEGFEEWSEKNRWNSFSRENYKILETKIDSFVSNWKEEE